MSPEPSPAIVVAAGAVCWRIVKGKLRVLLVHRAARADVSLPKGKLDPGESAPQAAVREIEEETGLRIALGVPLGTVEYSLSDGRDKIVHYWAGEVTDAAHAATTFSPNQEIAEVQWLTVDKARAALSFDRDRDVLDRFAELAASGRLKTFAVIALRHGKAVPPESWDGPDSTRPLLHRGMDQAESIAPAIAAYLPVKIMSSTAARCQATVAPLAALTSLPVKLSAGLSQDAYENDESDVRGIVARQLAKKRSLVMCSHGPVLPEILDAVVRETGTRPDAGLRRAAMLSTAEFTVMHVAAEHPEGGLVAVETHSPISA